MMGTVCATSSVRFQNATPNFPVNDKRLLFRWGGVHIHEDLGFNIPKSLFGKEVRDEL